MASAEQNLRNACETLDALTGVLDGLAVGIFARSTYAESATMAMPETAARVVVPEQTTAATRNHDPVCRCKNCGKRMKLSDTVNYYGLPACPACVHEAKPFEVVVESPETWLTQSQLGIQANA